MRPIDEKIISMKLDNEQFNKKAGESIESLTAINNAVKGINTDNVGKNVEKVAQAVSTKGAVAFATIQNLTNRVVDFGLKSLHNIFVKPLSEGFTEYETKMRSIQTIMANTKEPLEVVKTALEGLNTYADKTIYNFQQMTANLGLFTNAGLGLQESTEMIKGFMNVAAASGSDNIQAQRAAYQLSQGLANGVIKLMDWRSLTNANMGNANMRKGLVDIAVALGELDAKNATDTLESFNDTLKKGWLTSEVMSTYLRVMSGDLKAFDLEAIGLSQKSIQRIMDEAKTAEEAATKIRTFSQLMQTMTESIGSNIGYIFELILGDFDEATDRFSHIGRAGERAISAFFNPILGFLREARSNGTINNIWNVIKNVADGLSSFVVNGVGAITSIIGGFSGGKLANATGWMVKFTSSIKPSKDAAVAFRAAITNLLKPLKGLVDIAKQVGGTIFEKIFGKVGEFKIDKYIYMFSKWATGIGQFFDKHIDTGKIATSIFDRFKKVYEGIGSAIKYVKDLVSGKKTGSFITALMGTDNDIQEMDIRSKMLEGMTKSFETFSTKFNKVKDSMSGATGIWTTISNLVKEVAGAIDLVLQKISWKDVAKAGWIYTTYKAFKGLSKFVDRILGIFEDVTGMVSKLGKLFSSTGDLMKQWAQNMKAESYKTLGVGVLMLAGAIYILAQVDEDKLTTAVGVVVSLLLALATVTGQLTKLENQKTALFSFKGTGPMLFGLASALIAMAGAFKLMADIKPESLAASTIAMGSILTMMFLLTKGFSDPKLVATGEVLPGIIKRFGKSLLHISIAMKILSTIEPDRLESGAAVLVGILGVFTAFGRLTSGYDISGMSWGMMAMALSINMLLIPLTAFGYLPFKVIAQGGVTIGGLVLAFAGAARLAGGSDLKGFAASMIAIGAAMLMLMIPLQKLGEMNVTQLVTALAAIGGSVGIFVAFAAVTKPLAGGLLALTVPFAIFSAGILGIAGALYIFVEAAHRFIALGPAFASAMKDMIIIVIKTLYESMSEIVGGLVDFVMTFIVQTLTRLEQDLPTIVTLLINIFVKVVGILAERIDEIVKVGADFLKNLFEAILVNFSTMDFEGMLKAIAVMGAIGILMKLSQGLAAQLPGAMAGVAAIGIILAEIMAVLEILGAIYSNETVRGFIANGIQFFQDLAAGIGGALGALLGGIVGKFMETVASSLPAVATHLNDFMTELEPFLEKAQNIDASKLEGIKILSEVILALGAAQLMSALSNLIGWFTGKSMDFTTFGTQIVDLMESMQDFIESAQELPTDSQASVNFALAVIKELVTIYESLPKLGGVVGFFQGDQDFEKFGKGVKNLGVGLGLFIAAVKSMPATAATQAKVALAVVKELVDVYTALPNIGGAVGFFAGDQDLEKFGQGVGHLGVGLSKFIESIKTMPADSAGKAKIATLTLQELAAMQSTLSETGGLKSVWGGNKSLEGFSDSLVKLGDGVLGYFNKISGIDTTTISSITSSVKGTTQIDTSKGTGLSAFGLQLTIFGSYLATFYDTAKEITPRNLRPTVVAILDVTARVKELSRVDPKPIDDLRVAIGKVGSLGIDDLIKSLANGKRDASEAVKDLVRTVSDRVKMSATVFIPNTGKELIALLIAGMRSRNDVVKRVGSEVANKAKDGLNSVSMYQTGLNVSRGFADGIEAGKSRVINAAIKVAANAIAAAKKKLDINSPSRVFRTIGRETIEGQVLGMTDMVGNVRSAAERVTDNTIEAFSGLKSIMDDIITDDFSYKPVITPVLNLSEWDTFDGDLGSLDNTLGFDSNADMVNSIRRNQNTTNNTTTSEVFNNVVIQNKGLLEGAVFQVREETDIKKIALAIKQAERDEMVARGYSGV